MFGLFALGALLGSFGVIALGAAVGLALEPATLRGKMNLARAIAWLDATDWRRTRYSSSKEGSVR